MPLPQFQPGFRVGRYELLAPIAQGGMASVWAARIQGTRGFEKLVAVKTILPHLADDPHFETMFLDEARIASEIVHPNIAQVFDLGDQDGVLYLVCEWIDGESLAMLRRKVEERGEQIPVPIALHIMADVCAGLHAAHELCDATGHSLEVVHRDVSPQNIVISDAGAVKVIDFGVAKALNRALGETVAGGLKGKVQYMAPEQARNTRVDRRADLWSVGAVLYHLLAGRIPYEADSPLAVLNMLLSEDPPPPLPNYVPLSVADLVTRALNPDPAQRFQTAAEMQIAIVMALRDVSMPVTDAAIADYVRKYLGAQAEHRHKLVATALEVANQTPAPNPDLTLVEYVAHVEGRAPRADRTVMERDAIGTSYVMHDLPTVRPPAIHNVDLEEPEPVPLVRRSKPDWTQSDPEVNRGLDELRSIVLHTLPEPLSTSPKDTRQVAVPPSRSSRKVSVVLATGLLCLSAVFAWAAFREKPETDTTVAPTPSSAAAEPVVPPPNANDAIDAAPAIDSATPAASNAPATSSAAPADTERPRATDRTRPGSTVPLPPPGWESLPSVTLESDGTDEKHPNDPAPQPN